MLLLLLLQAYHPLQQATSWADSASIIGSTQRCGTWLLTA